MTEVQTQKTRNALKRIKSAIDKLDEALVDIKEEFPEAMYFFEGVGSIIVLSGESHDENYGTPRQDRTIKHFHIKDAVSGGW